MRSKSGHSASRGGIPRGAIRGRGRGRGRGGRGPSNPSSNQLTTHASLGGFSLADEARQTSRQDHSIWSETVSLRNKPVAFVSGGAIEPLKQLEELLGNVHLDDNTKPDDDDDNSPVEALFNNTRLSNQRALTPPPPGSTASHTIKTTLDHSRDEEDSAEIIGPEELERDIISAPQSQPEDSLFFLDTTRSALVSQDVLTDQASQERQSTSPDVASEDEEILFKGRDTRKGRTSSPRSQTAPAQRTHEEEVLQLFKRQNKKGNKKAIPRGNKPRKNSTSAHMFLRSHDDEDAIIADYIQNMKESGDMDVLLQYQDHSQRDIGGIESNQTSENDVGLEKSIREPEHVDAEAEGSEISISDSEVDDATLARMMSGNDLGLYLVNHSDSIDSDEEPPKLNQQEAKRIQKGIGDTYDDFDAMDWERPSLQRKGKGATARLPIQVSDSELETRLQTAWKNDRLKKSERKRQREELRALGLLGKNTDLESSSIKYPDGMSIEQVADEIRKFLVKSDQSLTLPPMDKHARRIIHEMANKLKLQSKSTGKGDQRRPTLYRTKRTPPYNPATFDNITSRVHRKYLPRSDKKGPKGQKLGPTGRASMAAVNVAEGEIVGGAAPELGTENRGRNMLEKMGWSTGTALGATHNKGILQPVTQAMKKSKAGLG